MWTKKALESTGEDIRKGYWGRKKWDIHLKWTHTPTHTLSTLFSVRVTESPRVLSGMLGSHTVPQGGRSWSGLFPSPGRCTEASRWGPSNLPRPPCGGLAQWRTLCSFFQKPLQLLCVLFSIKFPLILNYRKTELLELPLPFQKQYSLQRNLLWYKPCLVHAIKDAYATRLPTSAFRKVLHGPLDLGSQGSLWIVPLVRMVAIASPCF